MRPRRPSVEGTKVLGWIWGGYWAERAGPPEPSTDPAAKTACDCTQALDSPDGSSSG